MMTPTVKTVDMAPFLDGTDKEVVSKAILDSFKSIGFVYLINHGLSQEKIDTMFTWSRTLFDQSMDVKKLAPHPESGSHHRGYSSPGREKVVQYDEKISSNGGEPARQVVRDVKESFEVGREDDLEMPNIWYPEGVLPGFKEACLDFYWACHEIEKTVLRALAVGFGLGEDYFLQYHLKADNQLRLLHYPSVPASLLRDKASSRIPSHTDFCSITLLMQDNIGGLEVEDPNHVGEFISVPPIPGSIVLNAGDFLMRWSNNIIKSTVHRVRIPPTLVANVDENKMVPARYSIPYFCAADLSTVIDTVPGTWSAECPKLYTPISAKEYIIKRLNANY